MQRRLKNAIISFFDWHVMSKITNAVVKLSGYFVKEELYAARSPREALEIARNHNRLLVLDENDVRKAERDDLEEVVTLREKFGEASFRTVREIISARAEPGCIAQSC